MATLRYRNDKWQVQVRRHGHVSQTKTFHTKTDAQRWARHAEIELDRTLIPNDPRGLSRVTVADIFTRYFNNVTSSKRGYAPEAKRIEVFLRSDWSRLPLSRITPEVFARYRDLRSKQVGPGTVIRELGLLRTIFETARKEWGYSALTNPLAELKKPRAPQGRDRRLRPGELQALAIASTDMASWLRHGIHLAIETGLRRGELLGIRWNHVNFDSGVLHVPLTKTDRPRNIPLTDHAVAILTERKNASYYTNAGYAFPVSANAFRLAWERCKRRTERAGCAGIQDLRFHDLRHEAVSRFFELGLNTAEVAAISGHKDLRMLFRYTHLKAEDLVLKLRAASTVVAVRA